MARAATIPAIEFYVALYFDGISIIVPQSNVRVVEMIESVETYVEPEESMIGIMGWVSYFEQQYPVFTLSDKLRPLERLPEQRDFCALLETPEEAIYGLTCERIESLEKAKDLKEIPLPACMLTGYTPINHLLTHQHKVASVTDAQSLMRYLTAWAEEHMAEAEALIDE